MQNVKIYKNPFYNNATNLQMQNKHQHLQNIKDELFMMKNGCFKNLVKDDELEIKIKSLESIIYLFENFI